MKKILFSLVVLLAVACAMPSSAQVRLGAVAGVNLTTLQFNQDLIKVDQSVGYTAGVIGELMLPGIGFGLDASLLYTQQGATLHLGDKPIWASQGYGAERSYLHYLEIPINLRFKYTNLNGIENTIAPFIFAGPSLQVLLAHNKIEALDYAGGTLAVNVGVGCELFQKVQVAASYGFGVIYSAKTKLLDGYGAQNRAWKLTVAYMF